MLLGADKYTPGEKDIDRQAAIQKKSRIYRFSCFLLLLIYYPCRLAYVVKDSECYKLYPDDFLLI